MSTKQTFRDLIVWQKAIRLCAAVYAVTRSMPAAEQFGLVGQMRRAAVSIPSNIAEGNARGTRKDYLRSLIIARGSLAELETQLVIAQELRYLSDTAAVRSLMAEVSAMLQGLISRLRSQ